MHDDKEEAANPNAWRGKMTPEQIHRARSGYLGEISFIDTQIGRLLNWYRRHQPDAARQTWFIITSDHGDMQGDHNFWRKTYAYEGSARIPLIVTPPAGHPARRKVAGEVVELRDVMPTILSAAGLDVPPTVDGLSLLPLLNEPASTWRRYIHGEHCTCYSPEQEMQYVTDGRRKLIWLPRIDTFQFFNLETDPGECHNIYYEPAAQPEVMQWKRYLIDELESRGCNWVSAGDLVSPPPPEPLVSAYKEKKWLGEGA